MHIEREVARLDGYLKCLELICGREVRFAASVYVNAGHLKDDLCAWLQNCGYQFKDVSLEVISRAQYISQLWGPIQETVTGISTVVLKDLMWQLEEYLGLISTRLDVERAFHPLFRLPLYSAKFGDEGRMCTLLLLEFPEVVLVVSVLPRVEGPP
jgi:hypothetical protein